MIFLPLRVWHLSLIHIFYLYDHSGLAMSTESFSGSAPHAECDSGQVGWIYVSKEYALKEFDADKMTLHWLVCSGTGVRASAKFREGRKRPEAHRRQMSHR